MFGVGLRVLFGVRGAGVYLGVFGDMVGGKWLFLWLLVLARGFGLGFKKLVTFSPLDFAIGFLPMLH